MLPWKITRVALESPLPAILSVLPPCARRREAQRLMQATWVTFGLSTYMAPPPSEPAVAAPEPAGSAAEPATPRATAARTRLVEPPRVRHVSAEEALLGATRSASLSPAYGVS
jgi:hypothetical protein